MKPLPLVLGLLPLIVFGAMSARIAGNGIAWAAVSALAVAVADAWFAQPRRSLRIITVVQAGPLVLVAAVGFAGGPSVDRWLFNWGSGLVTLAVGLLILAALPVFSFTEQYARLSTPRAYWSAPTFKSINRVLSVAWGTAIAAIGLASILLAGVQSRAASVDSAHLLDLLLNWIAPIAVLWFMIRFTAAYPDRVLGAHYADNFDKGVDR